MDISDIVNNSKDKHDRWTDVIRPETANLIIGDKGAGKSALAFWMLERFSREYNLTPVLVGFPESNAHLLPAHFRVSKTVQDIKNCNNAIVFIDEADLQMPMEDVKARKHMIDLLSLPRHRNQILVLAFHFPKLILSRYISFFDSFTIKKPPFLLEFAGKSKGDIFVNMMQKAKERFQELDGIDVVRSSYIVAPHVGHGWQGVLTNPLCSFWSTELSKAWASSSVNDPVDSKAIDWDLLLRK